MGSVFWGKMFSVQGFFNTFLAKQRQNVHLLCSSLSSLAFFWRSEYGILASSKIIPRQSFLNGFSFFLFIMGDARMSNLMNVLKIWDFKVPLLKIFLQSQKSLLFSKSKSFAKSNKYFCFLMFFFPAELHANNAYRFY